MKACLQASASGSDEVTTRDEIKDGMMRPPHLLDV